MASKFGFFAHLLFVLPTVLSSRAQHPLNLDFEQVSVEGRDRPRGWSVFSYAPNVRTVLDDAETHHGSLSLKFTGTAPSDSESPHILAHWIEARYLKGKTLALTGWVKSSEVLGSFDIAMSCWGYDGRINEERVSHASSDEGALSLPWTSFEIEVSVPASAHSVYITAGLAGSGEAWLDHMVLALDGTPLMAIKVAPEFSLSEEKWLADTVSELATFEPLPFGASVGWPDLDAFRAIVGDAKIIALGESTHGTSEFFQLKHRLLQYAVSELNVRVFAIEANQLLVEQINEHVLHGKGSAEEAIMVMFAVWNTEEMLGLIRWLRAYNLENPKKMVEFVGFDMQDPEKPLEALLVFLEKWDAPLRTRIGLLLAGFKEGWRNGYSQTEATLEKWRDRTREAWKAVSSKKEEWLARATAPVEKTEIEWAVQNAKVIGQAAQSLYSRDLGDRDRAMAENIGWLLAMRPADTRMVVWAHDSHIALGASPDKWANYFGGASMGAHLAKRHGDDYRTFGLATYGGGYSCTVSQINHKKIADSLDPGPEGSLEEALHRIAAQKGNPNLLLDLRPARSEPAAFAWLITRRPARFIGYAASDYSFSGQVSFPYQFDALIFIDNTTPSNLLRP